MTVSTWLNSVEMRGKCEFEVVDDFGALEMDDFGALESAVLTVDLGRLEFTSRDSLGEQGLQFGERPVLGLGQSEPATR